MRRALVFLVLLCATNAFPQATTTRVRKDPNGLTVITGPIDTVTKKLKCSATDCVGATCPPQCPAGPKGDKGDTGATGATGAQGPQGIPGVCPTCSGTGSVDKSSYLDVKGFAVVDQDGNRSLFTKEATLRQGGYGGRRLELGANIGANIRVCDRAGDILVSQNAGTLAGDQPLTQPLLRYPSQHLKAGQLVYAGFAGSETPFAQWKPLADCTTNTQWVGINWCTTNGCIQTDGDCKLVRSQLAPLQFTHGNVLFKITPIGSDAYGCTDQNQFGQQTPNDGSLIVTRSDNQGYVVGGFRNQMDVRPGQLRSMMDNGNGTEWLKQAGDPRFGTYENEDVGWNTSYISKWGVGPIIDPPELPPVVKLVPAPGADSLPVGSSYCWNLTRVDKRWDTPTAASWRKECVDIKSPGLCMEVSRPEDFSIPGGFRWPIPNGGWTIKQTRYWACVGGGREWWNMFVDTLEDPNDKILICKTNQMQENPTCPTAGRSTIPVVTINDQDLGEVNGYWQPNMQGVITERSQVLPTKAKENARKYIATRFCPLPNDCRKNCDRGMDVRGVTGAIEPDWNSFGAELVPDGTVCWMRLPWRYSLTVKRSILIPLNQTIDTGPVPAVLIDDKGIHILNTNAAYPLAAPPLKEFTR